MAVETHSPDSLKHLPNQRMRASRTASGHFGQMKETDPALMAVVAEPVWKTHQDREMSWMYRIYQESLSQWLRAVLAMRVVLAVWSVSSARPLS